MPTARRPLPLAHSALLQTALAAAMLAATPALAADPAAGEVDFKRCRACHAATAPDGTVVQKGGKTGPDLYGVIGRPVAGIDGYAYGPSIKTAGAAGLVWTEAELAAYVTDPAAWLKSKTGEAAARSKMTFKLAKGAEDMAAYLATLSAGTPAAE